MSDVPPNEPTATSTADADDEHVMDLLAEHVPLALLVDLITPDGPASQDILQAEGMPEDAWWESDDAGVQPQDAASPGVAGATPAGDHRP